VLYLIIGYILLHYTGLEFLWPVQFVRSKIVEPAVQPVLNGWTSELVSRRPYRFELRSGNFGSTQERCRPGAPPGDTPFVGRSSRRRRRRSLWASPFETVTLSSGPTAGPPFRLTLSHPISPNLSASAPAPAREEKGRPRRANAHPSTLSSSRGRRPSKRTRPDRPHPPFPNNRSAAARRETLPRPSPPTTRPGKARPLVVPSVPDSVTRFSLRLIRSVVCRGIYV
jgi:hypothetical protein